MDGTSCFSFCKSSCKTLLFGIESLYLIINCCDFVCGIYYLYIDTLGVFFNLDFKGPVLGLQILKPLLKQFHLIQVWRCCRCSCRKLTLMISLTLFQIVDLGVHTLFNFDYLRETLLLSKFDVFIYLVFKHLLQILKVLLLYLTLLNRVL